MAKNPKVVHKLDRKARVKAILHIEQRDGKDCVWCGCQLSFLENGNGSLDHARPRSKGGSNWFGNLLLSCQTCNNRRENTKLLVYARRLKREGKNVNILAVKRAAERHGDPRICNHTYLKQITYLRKTLRNEDLAQSDLRLIIDNLLAIT